ncbi:MAG: transglutaminase family protein [Schwartzia sp.]|jgi:transglutaminase-like putative cysteine protease|nr:transglutaminase family protein [Schwartzia sp. (in: firmicutes)]
MGCELSFYFDTKIEFSTAVTKHNFLLRCIPAEMPEQRILSYNLSILPDGAATSMGEDPFGNRYCTGHVEKEHDELRYTLQGTAYRDDFMRHESTPEPFYLYPSPLTQPTKELREFFETLPSSGSPLEIATEISDMVHGHFSYTPGATSVSTTAGEAYLQAEGVCQDYAHVFITLCRMAGIPARYVSGLSVGEGASHAWAEIWDDGFWYGIDPTRGCAVHEGYLKLCVGRDYSDCPLERGVFSGGADQTQTVFMKVSDE